MTKKGSKAADSEPDFARLPAVSKLLEGQAVAPLLEAFGAVLVTELLREQLKRLRAAIQQGSLEDGALQHEAIAAEVEAAARALLAPRPRGVINATGVVVHTNLGRATLSEAAAEQVARAARGYVDLEYDVAAGKRGNRLAGLTPLMARLFPGHGFTVVNNNAAAVMLSLRALARDREVLVSRGELVEIGGSFRIPDVMSASGAQLVEVGTTNRTRLADYQTAAGEKTGLILKVHPSNFAIVGFTESTGIAELAGVARKRGLPLVVDWGSGNLVDLAPLGITGEAPIARLLADGADVVTFSGDKLLGSAQAGFIVGRQELIEKIRKDPLARVCRLDRLRIGALQQTLASYVTGRAFEEVPALRMLAAEPAELERRAQSLKEALVARVAAASSWIDVVDGVSRTGGGSAPSGERPTRLLAISVPSGDAAAVERSLREGEPPVVGRMQDGKLLLDLRTVLPPEERVVVERLAEVLATALEV
jgi:L-seryl-tRNA(Ser) seleniumtransferase